MNLSRFNGIHPGIILSKLLEKAGIHQRPFAISIGEHPQTINAITKGKRRLNTSLALKIENKLGIKEGDLVLLQAHFDIVTEKNKQQQCTPNLNVIRPVVFWDTDMTKINWKRQYKSVIKRVFERGNAIEKAEITRFYGKSKVELVLDSLPVSYLSGT